MFCKDKKAGLNFIKFLWKLTHITKCTIQISNNHRDCSRPLSLTLVHHWQGLVEHHVNGFFHLFLVCWLSNDLPKQLLKTVIILSCSKQNLYNWGACSIMKKCLLNTVNQSTFKVSDVFKLWIALRLF